MSDTIDNFNPVCDDMFQIVDIKKVLPRAYGPADIAMSSYGLNIPLTDIQRIVLSLVRGYHLFPIELTGKLRRLCGLENCPQRLWLPPGTEISNEGSSLELEFSNPITLLLCVAGRRSGKTTIASIIMAWLIYRLQRDKSFLESVPILPDSIVSILNLACDTHQARILFRMLVSSLHKLRLLNRKESPVERAQIGRVLIESLTSSSRSSRGRTVCGAVLDEFAHFQRTLGPLADRSVWTAIAPSLATFGPKGLAVITTSPAGRSGVVWDLFQQRGERDGMLTVQLPTWVMNPNITRESLDGEFMRDENLARQEYGAEFLAPHGRFLRSDDIRACVIPEARKPPAGTQRHIHVDLGLQHDATAIAMGYIEKISELEASGPAGSQWKVVIEHVETLQGSPSEPLNVSAVENRLKMLVESVGVTGITFDQHQSAYLVERLNAHGLNACVIPATSKSNQETYSFLRDLITTGRIHLPDHDQLIDELSNLECTITHRGFKVEASPGSHDDCADAVANCAWSLANSIASQWHDMLIAEPRA
jgi:hypothetical protein